MDQIVTRLFRKTRPIPVERTVCECGGLLVQDSGFMCCVVCGSSINQPTFCVSYSSRVEPIPISLYSRQSRFRRYIYRQSNVFNQYQIRTLRDAFAILETVWLSCRHLFKRKYFVSQSVILYRLCLLLFKLKLPPPLRATGRIQKQCFIIDTLLKRTTNPFFTRFKPIVISK
jgi:hypothetical protein